MARRAVSAGRSKSLDRRDDIYVKRSGGPIYKTAEKAFKSDRNGRQAHGPKDKQEKKRDGV